MNQRPSASTSWYRPEELEKLYRRVRQKAPGGGPPLQIVRSPPAGLSTAEALDLVEVMMARSLARVRFPPGDVRPAVAVRVDIEERSPDGRRELVVRLFDTGQVADPAGLKPFEAREEVDLQLRREPPTGPWAGVFALRVAIEEGDPEPNPR